MSNTTAQSGGLLARVLGVLVGLLSKKPAEVPAPPVQEDPRPAAEAASLDVDTLARTLWGEARGEGRAGIEAVAAVIVNRAAAARAFMQRKGKARHPLFGDGSLASACTANPGARYRQFSCWNEDDPNRAKLLAVTDADPAFRACQEIARKAAASTLPDPTIGATHYHDPRVCSPAWAVGAKLTCVIGNHRFYKDVP